MIEEAGLKKDALGINVQINQRDVSGEVLKYPGNAGRNYAPKETSGEAMCNLGIGGRGHCEHFAPLNIGTPAAVVPRTFTVRLHFAELEDIAPGQRVFDVNIQDQTAITRLDVTRSVGQDRRPDDGPGVEWSFLGGFDERCRGRGVARPRLDRKHGDEALAVG